MVISEKTDGYLEITDGYLGITNRFLEITNLLAKIWVRNGPNTLP
jgi:hypothetical protein